MECCYCYCCGWCWCGAELLLETYVYSWMGNIGNAVDFWAVENVHASNASDGEPSFIVECLQKYCNSHDQIFDLHSRCIHRKNVYVKLCTNISFYTFILDLFLSLSFDQI